jgi:hypothetical protein
MTDPIASTCRLRIALLYAIFGDDQPSKACVRAGVAQLVERDPSKVDFASLSLVSRCPSSRSCQRSRRDGGCRRPAGTRGLCYSGEEASSPLSLM